jgi:hypothetical protein
MIKIETNSVVARRSIMLAMFWNDEFYNLNYYIYDFTLKNSLRDRVV